MKIEQVNIEKLKFADYNPRGATDKEVAELKKSIERFGFVEPVIVNSAPKRMNIIIGGHFRVRMAKEMGIKEVPVHYIKITEIEKEKELNLRLNKNLGHWDFDLLADFDEAMLLDVGFDSDELDKLFLDLDPEDRDDEVPEIPEIPKSEYGDIYQLGEHRLMCGDATKKEDVMKLMSGQKADVVFTDPPYNVNYKGQGEKTKNHIKNDNMSADAFMEFLTNSFTNYRSAVKGGAGVYVFHSSSTQTQFEEALERAGFEVKTQLIWNKPSSALGWGDYRWKHEPFFYAGIKGEKTQFYGDRTHATVWDFQKNDRQLLAWAQKMKRYEAQGKTTVWSMARSNVNEYVHPTQKPVELISYALANSSKSGDIVLDFFMGSGSVLIACEKTKRVSFGMELDPKYIDVIIKRWEDYSGKKAEKVT